MKPRDRLVVSVLVAAAALAAVWIAVVSPKRQDASQLGAKLTVAQNRLGSAQSQLAAAKGAEAGYPQNLAVVKDLYKAVPANTGVPRLLVALDKSSHYKRIDFRVVTVTAGGTGAAAAAPQAALPGGLAPIGFTFTFNGGYISLQRFLHSIAGYTLVKNGQVIAKGRLLTIQSVALTPGQTSGASAAATTPTGTQAAVTATAYSQMPASAAAPVTSTSTASTPAAPATGTAATVATTTTTTK